MNEDPDIAATPSTSIAVSIPASPWRYGGRRGLREELKRGQKWLVRHVEWSTMAPLSSRAERRRRIAAALRGRYPSPRSDVRGRRRCTGAREDAHASETHIDGFVVGKMGGLWRVEVTCPGCGGLHRHGVRRAGEWRRTPCPGGSGGYVIARLHGIGAEG